MDEMAQSIHAAGFFMEKTSRAIHVLERCMDETSRNTCAPVFFMEETLRSIHVPEQSIEETARPIVPATPYTAASRTQTRSQAVERTLPSQPTVVRPALPQMTICILG